jgi:hypothetical protein
VTCAVSEAARSSSYLVTQIGLGERARIPVMAAEAEWTSSDEVSYPSANVPDSAEVPR